MTIALTAYLSSQASTTLTTANQIYITGGTPGTQENEVLIGTVSGWGEMYAQGNASAFAGSGSIGSPSGHGFYLETSILNLGGQQIIAGNWSGTIRSGLKTTGDTATVTFVVRAYKYSSGTYTNIATMTSSSQSFSGSSAITITLPSTSGSVMNFASGETLYIDVWAHVTTAATIGTQQLRFNNLSTDTTTHTGTTTENFVSPGYQVGTTTSTRTIPASAALLATNTRTIPSTAALLQTSTRTIADTASLLQTNTRTIPASAALGASRTIPVSAALLGTSTRTIPDTGALLQPNITRTIPGTAAVFQTNTRSVPGTASLLQTPTRTITTKVALLQTNTRTIPNTAALLQPNNTRTILNTTAVLQTNVRTIPATATFSTPTLTSGGFALFANGTGTVSFDSVRITQFPDPSMSLAPILPRIGATSVLYNANITANTTLGVDISFDGVNWTDITAQNGGMLPGIFSQPDPTIDGFKTNSSANYTSTSRTGGAPGAWTYDTSNSRVVATGGTNALYLYSAITDNDIDFCVDTDLSDAGGMVWRYIDGSNFYYLQIADSLSSTGAPNRITLYKVASNSRTQLATTPITYAVGTPADDYIATFVRGTYHRFRVTMLGGVITVYVDGVLMLTYTDGSPLASGKMGLYNNGGTTGSRYYQLWMIQIGDYVSGSPAGDIVTSKFVYTRLRLATTDASVSSQVLDITTNAFTPSISAGTTIPAITYTSSFLNTNFDDLAKQSNFSWYIDANKNFVFRAGATVAAPWILQSAPAGLVQTVDLEVDTDFEVDVSGDLYRNRQTILGAIDTGTFSETKVGDGSTRTFTLGNPLASIPTIVLNGVTKTNIGLKGTTGHDFYYAVNDAVIEQDAGGTVLQNSDTLTLSYTGLFATTVTVDSTTEQATRALIEGGTGIVENVEDHTGENLTKAAATTLANQLIARYAITGRSIVFRTSRDGLTIGQTLTVFLPEHGIVDGQFLITQVEIYLQKGLNDTQVWWYKVTCSELPKQDSWAKLIASGLGLQ